VTRTLWLDGLTNFAAVLAINGMITQQTGDEWIKQK
jgi:hypothetical protein